jgi:hypothetical protein
MNLSTYSKELNKIIFNQFTIVDHTQHHSWGLIPYHQTDSLIVIIFHITFYLSNI